MPPPWNWHIEMALHGLLIAAIWRRRPGLPFWQGWCVCRFVFDLAQLLLERSGHVTAAANVWYAGIVAGVPLLVLALLEARQTPKSHALILYCWVALNAAAAWIRFFPYTGRAVLIIDGAAWLAWLVRVLV